MKSDGGFHDFIGNMMGIFDGDKFDGNVMGISWNGDMKEMNLMGIRWELKGNIMGIKTQT